MKLKNILPRYLLREKSYGELELGAQVVEVTDLLIPAGTDSNATEEYPDGWNYQIGTISHRSDNLVLWTMTLEIAEVTPDGLQLTMPTGGESNIGGSVYLGPSSPNPGAIASKAWNFRPNSRSFFPLQNVNDVQDSIIGASETPWSEDPSYAVEHSIQLQLDGGVTTEDITVVRARAAFLVL